MPHFTYGISASDRRAGAAWPTHGPGMQHWNGICFKTLLRGYYLAKHNKAFPISRADPTLKTFFVSTVL
jgi:hypothetical protein